MARRFLKINSLSPRAQELTYLYTKGGELSLDGNDYVGEYHADGSGIFTGPIPSLTKKRLRKIYPSSDQYKYDQLFEFDVEVNTYVDPVPFVYTPSEQSYAAGFDNRFFVEKRADDLSYAIEIDQGQFARIGSNGGIDAGLYHSVELRWKLTGTLDSISNHNRYQLLLASKQVPSVAYAVPNFTQFSRVTQLGGTLLDVGTIPVVEDLPKIRDIKQAVKNYYNLSSL